MKKINSLFYIIGIVCIIVAGYILVDKFIVRDEIKNNFNEDEEIEILNDKLSEIGSPLGWIIIVDGINNQDRNGNYVITFNKNLFDNYEYRQLFVMEYILSNPDNYDMLYVEYLNNNYTDGDIIDFEHEVSYIAYDEYNSYYKSLFGEDFDIEKTATIEDKKYVYYDNRRAGSNDVYVSIIQAYEIEYDDGVYKGTATVTYSTGASELVGSSEDTAVIEYIKDINDNIILKSFVLKDR